MTASSSEPKATEPAWKRRVRYSEQTSGKRCGADAGPKNNTTLRRGAERRSSRRRPILMRQFRAAIRVRQPRGRIATIRTRRGHEACAPASRSGRRERRTNRTPLLRAGRRGYTVIYYGTDICCVYALLLRAGGRRWRWAGGGQSRDVVCVFGARGWGCCGGWQLGDREDGRRKAMLRATLPRRLA